MKNLLSTLILFAQLSFSPNQLILENIDYSNCRDGENVEYCKTHKLMNRFKKMLNFINSLLEDQKELKK